MQEQAPSTLAMRRPLPQLTLDEELPNCFLPDTEETPEEELEKAEMIHVRCALPSPLIPSGAASRRVLHNAVDNLTCCLLYTSPSPRD